MLLEGSPFVWSDRKWKEFVSGADRFTRPHDSVRVVLES